MNNKFFDDEKHSNAMVVYLSDVEKRTVKKWVAATKSKSVSEFLRHALYLIGCCNIRLRVWHEDLSRLENELHQFDTYLMKLLESLVSRTEVETEDVIEIQQKMDEIHATVVKCYKSILAGRRVQEAKVKKYLAELVEEILGVKNDAE